MGTLLCVWLVPTGCLHCGMLAFRIHALTWHQALEAPSCLRGALIFEQQLSPVADHARLAGEGGSIQEAS